MKLSIVGITGYAGAGKSTLASYLSSQHGYTEIALADPLKAAAKCLGWNGEKDAKGRDFLQRLGTEAIRGTFGADFWVDLLIERIGVFGPRFLCPYDEQQCEYFRCLEPTDIEFDLRCVRSRELAVKKIVIPDVRFVNEATKLRKTFVDSFLLIRVIRLEAGLCSAHVSETEQAGIVPDLVVINVEDDSSYMSSDVERFLKLRGHLARE